MAGRNINCSNRNGLFGRTGASVWRAESNADAERFVRSIKEKFLARLIPFGERPFSDWSSRSLSPFIIANGIIKG